MFLESTKKFEERLRKAIGPRDVMTEDPITIEPTRRREAARIAAKHNRSVVEHGADRRRHPHRRARRADRECGRHGSTSARSSATAPGWPRSAPLCAVVKADGYGHGAVEAALAAQRGGAAWLAVATAGEAAELRARASTGRCW